MLMPALIHSVILLVLQAINDIESQFAFDVVEKVSSILLIVLATTTMMLIPVVLFYSMVHHFYSIKNFNAYNSDVWNQGNTFKDRYLKLYSNFFKHFSALFAWNVFSFLYIFFGFESFTNGIKVYFYFPFYVFEYLIKNDAYNSIYLYKSNWMFMILITILTICFYLIGKYIGRYIAENKILKGDLSISFF